MSFLENYSSVEERVGSFSGSQRQNETSGWSCWEVSFGLVYLGTHWSCFVLSLAAAAWEAGMESSPCCKSRTRERVIVFQTHVKESFILGRK